MYIRFRAMVLKASSLDELLIFVCVYMMRSDCSNKAVWDEYLGSTCVIRHGEREAPELLTHNIDMEYNLLLDSLSVILKS